MRRTSLGEDLNSRGGHENGGERKTYTSQRMMAWIPVATTRMTAKEKRARDNDGNTRPSVILAEGGNPGYCPCQ